MEDFWNTPRGGSPTPKDEERISDKICESIRCYFREHALTAEREVQVRRRCIARKHGGAPGSEVDVLVRIPGVGTAEHDPIVIPIEVKRSDNDEARTGLREELVNRYMKELGTNYGVFIVVWLEAPGLQRTHPPIWSDRHQAAESLREQVKGIVSDIGSATDVRTIILNASLI